MRAVGNLGGRGLGVARREPGGDVRGRGGGRVPQQLRRQPFPLPPGSNQTF